MQDIYAYDADAIMRQIGSEYVNTTGVNWTCAEESFESLYSLFEQDLTADTAIDYIGIKVYFKDTEPVAWADDENGVGYK